MYMSVFWIWHQLISKSATYFDLWEFDVIYEGFTISWNFPGRFENGFFEDEVEDDGAGEDFRIRKWDEDYEDNPYDILRVMLNYVDDDAGTALHLATKVF